MLAAGAGTNPTANSPPPHRGQRELVRKRDSRDDDLLKVLDKGYRTGDIMQPGMTKIGTEQMGDLIASEI